MANGKLICCSATRWYNAALTLIYVCRWDPIERRNYGEPVHEDNDILGIFSPDVYSHVTPAWGAVQFVRLTNLRTTAKIAKKR